MRVCRVELDAPTLEPEVVHRVPHAPAADRSGHLRWDWPRIVAGVIDGLERCVERGPLASIGVDTWAVDYGLLDESGRLLDRAILVPRSSHRRLPVDRGRVRCDGDVHINGLQLQPFNTLFQLARHDADELRRSATLLWLPELIVHELTGVAVTERTSAGSSGLVDVSTGTWSPELIAVAGIERSLLGEITVLDGLWANGGESRSHWSPA